MGTLQRAVGVGDPDSHGTLHTIVPRSVRDVYNKVHPAAWVISHEIISHEAAAAVLAAASDGGGGGPACIAAATRAASITLRGGSCGIWLVRVHCGCGHGALAPALRRANGYEMSRSGPAAGWFILMLRRRR